MNQVKIEGTGRVKKFRLIKRKQYCSEHNLKIAFKCVHPDCLKPYLCKNIECLQMHFHNQELRITRLNHNQLRQKREKAQQILNNYEKYIFDAKKVNNIVSGCKHSLLDITEKIQSFIQTCQHFSKNQNKVRNINQYKMSYQFGINQKAIRDQISKDKSRIVLNYMRPERMEEVQNILQEEQASHSAQDTQEIKGNQIVQEAQNLQEPQLLQEPQIPQEHQIIQEAQELSQSEIPPHSKEITKFLEQQIKGFNWEAAEIVWTNQTGLYKLPQAVAHKCNLLFLFIGEKKLIGSYFPSEYPSIQTKSAKAPGSFIFLQQDLNKDIFDKFKAVEASHHVQLTEKQLICQGNIPSIGDGIRLSTYNIKSPDLSYYFPTDSFERETDDNQEKYYSGLIRLKQIYIYQLELVP